MSYLGEKQYVYQLCYVSALSWLQWANWGTWLFVCGCARVECTMRKFLYPNTALRRPICSISVCWLLLCKKAKSIWVTKCTKKIQVSDVIWVIERVGSAQHKSVWITTVMLHPSMHPTASLSTQTRCPWLRYLKLLMIRRGNRGDGAGWGKVRKSSYIYQKLVKWSPCRKLPAGSAALS